jgi:hypothetical protein
MELYILILIVSQALGLQNASSLVEDECNTCILNNQLTFYKIFWSINNPAEYTCRSSATLVSKFGYVVDSACDSVGCANISHRPLLGNSRRYGYFDCRLQETVETSNHHAKIVQIIRDYLEIFLMSIVCAILVLKKRLLVDCIQSHRNAASLSHQSLAEDRSAATPLREV